MDVNLFVGRLGRELRALARTDGEQEGVLTASLESTIQRTLFDVLAAAVDEINRELAPGSVELLFPGREESALVVTPSPPGWSSQGEEGSGTPHAEEGPKARVGVRVSERLKVAVSPAAGHGGRSAEVWSGQTASAALRQDRTPGTTAQRGKRCRQHYSAWVR